MIACQSKEEKAAELIKNELSKTLYDFESYSPIETVVTEAKSSVYTDTTCWRLANLLAYAFDKAKKEIDDAKEAKERMEIWGPPTSYSSTYSDKQYYKYKEEWSDKFEEAMATWEVVKQLAIGLKDSILALDENKIVGWEVKHRFRCKTKGGNSTIGDYRYVLDEGFEYVLIREDTDDDEYEALRGIVQSVLDGDFNKD